MFPPSPNSSKVGRQIGVLLGVMLQFDFISFSMLTDGQDNIHRTLGEREEINMNLNLAEAIESLFHFIDKIQCFRYYVQSHVLTLES